MKRVFEVEVERTDRYIVEIDDAVMDEAWQENFNQYFYEFDDLSDHAEHLAQHKARFNQSFIEGYGTVLLNGAIPFGQEENRVNRAVNIITVSEDDEIDVQVKEKTEE